MERTGYASVELNARYADASGDERAGCDVSAFLRERGFALDDGFYTTEYGGREGEVGEWRQLFVRGSSEPLGALHIRYPYGDQGQHQFAYDLVLGVPVSRRILIR